MADDPEFPEDNPEWTEADFARARPVSEHPVLGKVFAKSGKPVGRPTGSDKERITIRIDKDVLTRFRASGPGWQSRMNEALRKAIG
jgi:uncharacterized protein (DUF4415 family)